MRRAATAAAALLALCSLGAPCSPGGPAPKVADVWFDPPIATVAPGTFATFDLVVNARGGNVQAFQFDVEVGDPLVLSVVTVMPHAGFDDDGKLFAVPSYDLVEGSARRAADFRHGGEGVGGTFRAARVRVFAWAPGETSLRLTNGGLATGTGDVFQASPIDAAIVVD
jgi:hypothetical protein